MHVQEIEPGIYSICFGDSRLLEGRASGVMQRHAWANPLLYELAAYQRPANLIYPLSNQSDNEEALAFEAAAAQVTPSTREHVSPCGTWRQKQWSKARASHVIELSAALPIFALSTLWPSLLHRC